MRQSLSSWGLCDCIYIKTASEMILFKERVIRRSLLHISTPRSRVSNASEEKQPINAAIKANNWFKADECFFFLLYFKKTLKFTHIQIESEGSPTQVHVETAAWLLAKERDHFTDHLTKEASLISQTLPECATTLPPTVVYKPFFWKGERVHVWENKDDNRTINNRQEHSFIIIIEK